MRFGRAPRSPSTADGPDPARWRRKNAAATVETSRCCWAADGRAVGTSRPEQAGVVGASSTLHGWPGLQAVVNQLWFAPRTSVCETGATRVPRRAWS